MSFLPLSYIICLQSPEILEVSTILLIGSSVFKTCKNIHLTTVKGPGSPEFIPVKGTGSDRNKSPATQKPEGFACLFEIVQISPYSAKSSSLWLWLSHRGTQREGE